MRSTRIRITLLAVLAAAAGCADQLPTTPASTPATGGPSTAVEPYAGRIRIGVVPAAASVRVGANGAYEVREKGTNTLLLSGAANEMLTVTWDTVSVSVTSRRLQVVCTSSTADRDQRIANGIAAGFPSAAEFVATANCWRVYVGERPLPIDTAAERVYKDRVIAAGQATSAAIWKTVTLPQDLPRYVLTRSTGAQVLSAAPPVVRPSTGQVIIGTATYRGTAEVARNAAGTLAGINELPMEEYLYGVVPRELGPATYPEAEAQKAQAVAARTYAHANLGKHWNNGYDMGATVADQVYGGFAAEHPTSTSAVNATAGIVATYNGALIDALFYATSGGRTSNSEDVFSGTVPYLRGVWDAPAGQELSGTPALLADLRNPSWTGAYGGFHSYHRWNYRWTSAQMSCVIGDFANRPVGKVNAINILARSATGRVTQIEYVTDAGTFVDNKTAIRSSLAYINGSGVPTLLPSTLFVVERLTDASGALTGYAVYGGGNGHGAGLAQTGAVGMARTGRTYDQILKAYYTGIALEQKVGTRRDGVAPTSPTATDPYDCTSA
ncbi:MAG TPA: SpoIID/LytB domain-containing protein [Longimicrobium sp.]|jgi:stage II sporulation protein D|uniref:SpoIID/LytB domain-containing protein n=1 Tax=Longimicrobium sp. TaxID=2029185 RepID=UPI002ED914C8